MKKKTIIDMYIPVSKTFSLKEGGKVERRLELRENTS